MMIFKKIIKKTHGQAFYLINPKQQKLCGGGGGGRKERKMREVKEGRKKGG